MSGPDLKLIVLTGSDTPEILDAWSALEPVVRHTDGVQVVGVFSQNDCIDPDTDADIAVVLGGDGSILRGCRQMGPRQKPIIGINLGRLGFLADVTPEQFCSSLEILRHRRFDVVDHLMLKCSHYPAGGDSAGGDSAGGDSAGGDSAGGDPAGGDPAGGEPVTDLGLNEVMVTSGGSLKMLDVHLEIDFQPVTTFSCDGLIISTPVGSTAHNLSAGGPILRQDLHAFCITPICPHSLTVRPIVDSAERTYTLTVTDPPEGVMVVIDGQTRRPLKNGERVVVTRSTETFQLVRLPGHSYYGTLHRKLRWGGQPGYRRD